MAAELAAIDPTRLCREVLDGQKPYWRPVAAGRARPTRPSAARQKQTGNACWPGSTTTLLVLARFVLAPAGPVGPPTPVRARRRPPGQRHPTHSFLFCHLACATAAPESTLFPIRAPRSTQGGASDSRPPAGPVALPAWHPADAGWRAPTAGGRWPRLQNLRPKPHSAHPLRLWPLLVAARQQQRSRAHFLSSRKIISTSHNKPAGAVAGTTTPSVAGANPGAGGFWAPAGSGPRSRFPFSQPRPPALGPRLRGGCRARDHRGGGRAKGPRLVACGVQAGSAPRLPARLAMPNAFRVGALVSTGHVGAGPPPRAQRVRPEESPRWVASRPSPPLEGTNRRRGGLDASVAGRAGSHDGRDTCVAPRPSVQLGAAPAVQPTTNGGARGPRNYNPAGGGGGRARGACCNTPPRPRSQTTDEAGATRPPWCDAACLAGRQLGRGVKTLRTRRPCWK